MRVLLTCVQADSAVRQSVAQLADGLIARGHQVIVVTDALPLETEAIQVDARADASAWALRGLMLLVQVMRRYRVHVAQHAGVSGESITRMAARLARVPVVPPVAATDGVEAEVTALERQYRSAYVAASRFEIPILCYHRLVEQDREGGPANIHLRVDKFEEQLQYLRAHRYRTVHFADLRTADVFEPRDRRIMLTFDDGYEDNYRLLFPLLQKYQVKAVIYLVSGLERNSWDAHKGEPSLRLLNAAERREMLASGLVEFGAHTVTHADLSAVSADEAADEIRASKAQLESMLGVPVETLAYPYGRCSRAAKDAAREAGFRYALATNSGPQAMHEDPYHVRRIVVFPSITPARFARKVSGRYVQRPSSDPAVTPELMPRYADVAAGPAV
ncbi:MAG: polysaccharide deacetylase family protein [Gemmatimonadaceae bacterium]|nr:polysaccharide deacetylase family protein [Gemmatimonadaceae bacterium]